MENSYVIIDTLGARHATIKANTKEDALDAYGFPHMKHLLYAVEEKVYNILTRVLSKQQNNI